MSAASIPNRRKPDRTRARDGQGARGQDRRGGGDGFDGTWVADPDLVPEAKAGSDAAWVSVRTSARVPREDVDVHGRPAHRRGRSRGGAITDAGVPRERDRGPRYLDAWAGRPGRGGDRPPEADRRRETSRSQRWQWPAGHGVRTHRGATLVDGALLSRLIDEACREISDGSGARNRACGILRTSCARHDRGLPDPGVPPPGSSGCRARWARWTVPSGLQPGADPPSMKQVRAGDQAARGEARKRSLRRPPRGCRGGSRDAPRPSPG